MHLFATVLTLGEILLCTLSEWREKSLFISRMDHDRGQRAFLASVAHELRTPLHGIVGMLSSLMSWQEATQQLPKKADNWVRVANECSFNLLHLVNDVLDLTKSEIGQLTLQRDPFNLRDAIEYCTDLAGVSLKVRHRHCNTRRSLVTAAPATAKRASAPSHALGRVRPAGALALTAPRLLFAVPRAVHSAACRSLPGSRASSSSLTSRTRCQRSSSAMCTACAKWC